jgi:hypothetical protein
MGNLKFTAVKDIRGVATRGTEEHPERMGLVEAKLLVELVFSSISRGIELNAPEFVEEFLDRKVALTVAHAIMRTVSTLELQTLIIQELESRIAVLKIETRSLSSLCNSVRGLTSDEFV